MSTGLVWFKRDLRLADHAPLAAAQACERALAVFIIEPAWLTSPECDTRHVAYLLAALAPLQADLAALGLPLQVRVGEAVEVLEGLRREHGVSHLFSHEETGPLWSYRRDQGVAVWARTQGVAWQEFPQTGVVRRLRDRSGWALRWQRRMDAPAAGLAGGFRSIAAAPSTLPSLADLGQPPCHVPLPTAGERAAAQTLASFLAGRGRDYRRALSSPLTAEQGCSRLSEHLAFGTISLRTVHQATEHARRSTADRQLAYALTGFAGRLRWHCHFMQKLEDEPLIEQRNFARSHDGLRAGDGVHPEPLNHERLQAWCLGLTGFPMVDACMRQLRATGWLNFRMRAMLVSFAAYQLGLHWREPGLHLARLFLDFEPGIHWSQMQMQSGTTGINTLRVYSPAKQALDHDPQGHYRERWLPEFASAAYPAPIVDERASLALIKAELYARRGQPEVRAEAAQVQARHGSRKSGLPPTTRRAKPPPRDSDQGELF